MKKCLLFTWLIAVGGWLYAQPGNTVSCSVQVGTSPNPNNICAFFANPTGTPPFTYKWNIGPTTPCVPMLATYFGDYCVTITDANGCMATDCAFSNPACAVVLKLSTANTGIAAVPIGTPPFMFAWSNGATTSDLTPAVSGNYCVTVTDATGCTATNCIDYVSPATCGVEIDHDSVTIVPSGGVVLKAKTWGQPPFTWQWSHQNLSTSQVLVTTPGDYCVTITDAAGCTATDCHTVMPFVNFCTVTIVEGNASLSALTPTAGFVFSWNTGATTQSILPAGSGTYCVTATNVAFTCQTTACYDYTSPLDVCISGLVQLPDSTNIFALTGTVELYRIGPTINNLTLEMTVDLFPGPNITGKFYKFCPVSPGLFLIRAKVSPDSPLFDKFLPTYYGQTLFWYEATPVSVPGNNQFRNITLIKAPGVNGPGIVSGTVKKGQGLSGNPSADRSNEPVTDASVLLFDPWDMPLTHVLTDSEGKYVFEHLAFGTYQVGVEIPGKTSERYWVTLSAENPVSNGHNFIVREESIVLNTSQQELQIRPVQVSPNPAQRYLRIHFPERQKEQAKYSLFSSTGHLILSGWLNNLHVDTGWIELPALPDGLYWLQINTSSQIFSSRFMIKQ